jgi:hypothetical protein
MILKQISKNRSFEIAFFKNCDLKTLKNYIFKSHGR